MIYLPFIPMLFLATHCECVSLRYKLTLSLLGGHVSMADPLLAWPDVLHPAA
jgi:hypothetical protein